MITRHIPNFVTILNLMSGTIAIVFAFDGNLILSCWFIGFAAIFDFMDGMLARLLNARSAVGLQLDSLADVVSFGLAPAIIVYHLMMGSYNIPFVYFSGKNLVSFSAFIIAAFSALRLAKFNVDESQTESFLGLPTPANALFFASLPLVMFQAEQDGLHWILELGRNFWVLLGLTLVFSYLLVSPVRLFSLKLKNFNLKDNLQRYLLLGLSLVLIIVIKLYALPIIVVLYIVLSLVSNALPRKV